MITDITNRSLTTSKKAHVNETGDSRRAPVHKDRGSLRLLSMPMNSPAAPEAPPVPTKTPAPTKPEPARPVPAPTRREQDPDSDPGAVPCPPSECPLPR